MAFGMCVLAICMLWKAKFRRSGFDDKYLCAENSKAVKGLLAVLVIMHHLAQKTEGGVIMMLLQNMGILCVSLFFFLSGYGLQKSFAGKPNYRSSILRRRIPSVLLPYLSVTLIYWIQSFFEGAPYAPKDVLMGMLNGDPIVPYSWYVLCILVLYLGYYVSVSVFRDKPMGIVACNALLACGWVICCKRLGFGEYWYNAVITFSLGIFWAVYEKKIVPFLRKRYIAALLGGFCVFALLFCAAVRCPFESAAFVPLFWVSSCAFVCEVLLILMKVTFKNRLLLFLGDCSFEIYMMQGFFMTLYRGNCLRIENFTAWGAAVMISTVVSAWLLHKIFRRFPGKLFFCK